MPLAQTETSYYVRRLYKFLKEGHQISFGKHRAFVGALDYPFDDDSAHIRLDFRRDMLSTLDPRIHSSYPSSPFRIKGVTVRISDCELTL
jgi:hypothetical protein